MGTMVGPNPGKQVVSQEDTELKSRSRADSPQIRLGHQNQATGKKQRVTGKKQAEAGWTVPPSGGQQSGRVTRQTGL